MSKQVISKKGNIIISIFLTIVSVIYTLLVKYVDVKAIARGTPGFNGAGKFAFIQLK